MAEKEAKKNLGGRPREHNREEIEKELIEWAALPDSINLNGFCCTRTPPLAPSMITNWAREETPEGLRFRRTYEAAKTFIGMRREAWLATDRLHVKAYDLNAATYDHFLKDERRAQLKFESDLKKEETIAVAPEAAAMAEAILTQMREFQNSKKSS